MGASLSVSGALGGAFPHKDYSMCLVNKGTIGQAAAAGCLCWHPAHPAGERENGTCKASLYITPCLTVRPGSPLFLLVMGGLGQVENSCHCDGFPISR